MIDFAKLEQETLRIASKKISQVSYKDIIKAPRLGTGGGFDGIFLWDTAFTCMWAGYFIDDLPVYTSLDNLYRLQDNDGFIHRQYTAEGEPVFPKGHPSSFAPLSPESCSPRLYHYAATVRKLLVRIYRQYLSQVQFYQ